MSVTIITVPVPKAGKSFEVDFASLPENAQDFIIEYGVRQILNDALSGAKNPKDLTGAAKDKLVAENAAIIGKKLDALKSGEVRVMRATTADPVEREARRIAIDQINAHPAWRKWLADNKLKATDDAARAKFADLVKARQGTDAVQTEAKKRVDSAGKIADFDLAV